MLAERSKMLVVGYLRYCHLFESVPFQIVLFDYILEYIVLYIPLCLVAKSSYFPNVHVVSQKVVCLHQVKARVCLAQFLFQGWHLWT